MSTTKGYRQLIVWQKAMEMIPEVYRIIRVLPKEERFGMAEQMRRAAVSVVANMAEGQGRNGKRDFAHFLDISQGSLSELDTLLSIAIQLEYVPETTTKAVSEKLVEVRKLLFGLLNKLRTS